MPPTDVEYNVHLLYNVQVNIDYVVIDRILFISTSFRQWTHIINTYRETKNNVSIFKIKTDESIMITTVRVKPPQNVHEQTTTCEDTSYIICG